MDQNMPALNPARAELLQMFALDARIVRGTGFSLYDEDGREYLDFLSQYGALPFGHNPPRLWAALNAAQTEQLPSLVQPLIPVEAEKLAQRLAEITPGDLAITTFANSGAETVEAAIKLARIRTGRKGILSTHNGFHGKTLGALSATGKPVYQKGFNAPAPGFDYVEFGNLDALRERLDAAWAGTAAFIVEPIQGEGGVVCPPDGYIDDVITLCRSYGVLVILDEIQTGLGRTGELFACSNGREVPDMLLLAKALGGGMMPIGACIVRPDVWDDRFGRNHSSTFANNNLAARVANATLDMLLEDDQAMIRRVAENGAYLRERLETLQALYPEVIEEVRGRGYMVGLSFHPFDERVDSATMAFASLNGGVTPLISSYLFNVEGLLTAPLFNETHVIRLQPTLIAGRAELDRALDALTQVCDIIDQRDYYTLVRHLVAKPLPEMPEAVRPVPGADAAGAVPNVAQTGKFAFVIHYTEEEDIFRSDPSFSQFDADELSNWREWVKGFGPGFARKMPSVTSKTGATAEGWLMSVPMLPGDMRGAGRHAAASMIKTAVDMAGEDNVSRVGLGAFTSIVTRGGETATGRGVPITSGNTLTTISAVKGIKNMAACADMPLKDAHVVVVGASGAIGRLASLMLSREVGRVSLVGNAANPFTPRLLARVANEMCDTLLDPDMTSHHTPGDFATRIRDMAASLKLERGSKDIAEHLVAGFHGVGDVPVPLDWKTPLETAVEDADIVLVATSSEMALIDPLKLRPGTLVCDIARPPNVADADIPGQSVMVFDGGLVQPPFKLDLGSFQTLPANLCWGCLGETMLLALAQEDKDYSIGSRLSLADADHLEQLAEEHGFEPAAPQWYGRHVSEADIDNFAAEVSYARQMRMNLVHYSGDFTQMPAGE
jgi:acetylornithine/succinyldiaminopimelate/putrescine aminotransferase/predicted amino acid dehydrogenase